MRIGRLLFAALLLSSAAGLSATPLPRPADPTAEMAAKRRADVALEAGLHPQSGRVTVPGAHATLDLGDRYIFLPATEAKRVLNEGWGNPPEAVTSVLGMVLPKGKHFYDETWGAVIQYDESGHVDDKDAADQNYDEVMTNLKTGEEESNKAAREAGYAGGTTIGWAQAPTYDAATRTLIWARNIKFDNTNGNTLNYDVRTLSRTGTLSLNMVDSLSNIDAVRAAARDLGRTVKFDDGQRYADFDSKTDKLADYGLAGLVAGGVGLAVAKKIGILGLALVFLKKGFIILLIALAGGWRWIKRKFGKGDAEMGEDGVAYEASDDPYMAGHGESDMPAEPAVETEATPQSPLKD